MQHTPSLRSWMTLLALSAPWVGTAHRARAQPAAHPSSAQASLVQPGTAISRKLLDRRAVEDAPGMETELWLIEYPPGASAPVHHHPVVGIGYVIEGAFDSTFAGQPPLHVSAGQSFVDPARVEHRSFRNSSPDHPLRFVVAYTLPSGVSPVQAGAANPVQFSSIANPIAIARPALYPETIEVNPRKKEFLVGSVREGAVYRVRLDGKADPLIQDERLTSILGIVVDPRSNRLLVTNSDLGVSTKHSEKGPKREAGVGIYDLASGRRLHYVDLSVLRPDREHLINGITVDARGNAYVTDSFASAIYKIDEQGVPSVFLEDDEFKGTGINLNGIVFHPAGFLLAVKKSTGVLYRVPLAEPRRFTRVRTPIDFIGGDGLQLVGTDHLVLVANQTPAFSSNSAFVLRSSNDWQSAELLEAKKLGDVYPTTSVALDGKLYALSSHLDEWIGAGDGKRDGLAKQGRQGQIQEIGVVPTEARRHD